MRFRSGQRTEHGATDVDVPHRKRTPTPAATRLVTTDVSAACWAKRCRSGSSNPEAFPAQDLHRQFRRGHRRAQEGHVEVAGKQGGHQAGVSISPCSTSSTSGASARNSRVKLVRGRAGEPDLQAAGFPARGPNRGLDCFVDRGQDRPAARRQLHARGGEVDLAGGPLEQRRADFVLEPLDLLSQRRLRDVQQFGCPVEVQLLGEHRERPQASQFHARALTPSRTGSPVIFAYQPENEPRLSIPATCVPASGTSPPASQW